MMSTEKNTTQWESVPVKDLNKPVTKDQNGVKIQFMLSPSDVPAAWRARKVEKENSGHQYEIEFKYLSSPEPVRIESQGNGVELEVGKNSKRIYKIILNPSEICENESEVQVEIRMGVLVKDVVKKQEKSGVLNEGNLNALLRFFNPIKNVFKESHQH